MPTPLRHMLLQLWGMAANAGSILYYTSPLATVMKARNGCTEQEQTTPRSSMHAWHGMAWRGVAWRGMPWRYTCTTHHPFALQVVRQKDSASIHAGNAIMSIVNCSLW